MSIEKRKQISEMCPICEDWSGKNVKFKLCEKCKFESEIMYNAVMINVGEEDNPVFKSLKEIMERKL